MVKFVKPKLVFADDKYGGSGLDQTLGNNVAPTDMIDTMAGNGYTYAYLAESSDLKTLFGLPADFDDWSTFNAQLVGSPHLTFANGYSTLDNSGYDPVSHLSIYEDADGSLYVRFAWGLADPKGMVFGDKWSGDIKFVKGDKEIEVKSFTVIGTAGDCDPEIPTDDGPDPEPGEGWFSAQDDYVHGLNVVENEDGTLDITKNGSSQILSANVLYNDVSKDGDGGIRTTAAPIIDSTFEIFGGSIKTSVGDLYFSETEANQIFSFTQHTTGNVTVRLDSNALNDVIIARNTDADPDNDIHVSGTDFHIEAFYNAQAFGPSEYDTGEGFDINGNADTYAGGKVIFDGTMTPLPDGYFEANNDGYGSNNVQGADQMSGTLNSDNHTFDQLIINGQSAEVGIKVFNNDITNDGVQSHTGGVVGDIIKTNTIEITDENGGSQIVCGGVKFKLELTDALDIFIVHQDTQSIGINIEALNNYIINWNLENPDNKIDPGMVDEGGNNIAEFTLTAQYNAIGNWDGNSYGYDGSDAHGDAGAKVTFFVPRMTVSESSGEFEARSDYVGDTDAAANTVVFDAEGNITGLIVENGDSPEIDITQFHNITANDVDLLGNLTTGTEYCERPDSGIVQIPDLQERNAVLENSVEITGGRLVISGTTQFYDMDVATAQSIFKTGGFEGNEIKVDLAGLNAFLADKDINSKVILIGEYNAVGVLSGKEDLVNKNNLLKNSGGEDNGLGHAGATVAYFLDMTREGEQEANAQEVNYSIGFVTDEDTNIDEINSDTNSDNSVNEDAEDLSQASYDNLFELLDQLEATASGDASLMNSISGLKSTLNSSMVNSGSSSHVASAATAHVDSVSSNLSSSASNQSLSSSANSSANLSTSTVINTPEVEDVSIASNRTIQLVGKTANGSETNLIKLVSGYHYELVDGQEIKLTKAGADAVNYLNNSYNDLHADVSVKTTMSNGSITTTSEEINLSSNFSAGQAIYNSDPSSDAQAEATFSITTDGMITYQNSTGAYSTGFSSTLGSLASSASSNQSSSSSATANSADLLGDRDISFDGGLGHVSSVEQQGDTLIIRNTWDGPCGEYECNPQDLIDVLNQLFGSGASGSSNASYQPSYSQPAYEPVSYADATDPIFDTFHF